MKKILTLSALAILAGCSSTSNSLDTEHAPLPIQQDVDLEKYVGTWHEQARLPHRFQEQCVADVQAEYILNDDQSLKVTNSCRTADGSITTAIGEGRLSSDVEPTDPAKLEVRFAPTWLSWSPKVWGDYWILKLQGDYEYSLVGTPDREYLWVLSREKEADQAVVKELLDYAATQGFDIEKVERSNQELVSGVATAK